MDATQAFLDFDDVEGLDRTERSDPGIAAGRSRTPMAVKAAARTLRSVVPGSRIVQLYPVWRLSRFRETWSQRRARARHDRDLDTLVVASTLLDAVERVPRGWLVAGELTLDGVPHAVWVDADRGVWLARAPDPGRALLGA